MSTIARQVVFFHGRTGRQLVDQLTRNTHWYRAGPTDATIGDLLTRLLRWDYGDHLYVHNEPGKDDLLTERDVDGRRYRLTWNERSGFISLDEIVIVDEAMAELARLLAGPLGLDPTDPILFAGAYTEAVRSLSGSPAETYLRVTS
jgi:hypothetical protein